MKGSRNIAIAAFGISVLTGAMSIAEESSWKDAPIVGLAPSTGATIGRVMIVPDASGGIWRVDTETGMVSRCWHRIDLEVIGKEAALAGPWEKYQQQVDTAPVCSAWTEF